jgi:hypothetical protein
LIVCVVAPFDQRKLVPPLAVRITDPPWQKAVGPPAAIVAVGNGFTVTVPVWLAEQIPAVPVTVYIVVKVGLAMTEEPDVVFKPVPGLHENEFAPPAVNVAELPLHMVAELTVKVRLPITETVATAVFVQPARLVPVTV